MYYRIFDRQCGQYFSTGYNAESMPDLLKQFSYFLTGRAVLLSWEEIAEQMQGLEIERDDLPFEEL